jgi:hypothetical protein
MYVTQFTKPVTDGGMSKTIKLGPDGKPVSDGSACRMWRGEACVYDLMDVNELALLIDRCSTQQALAFGSIRPEFLNGGGPVQVVLKEASANATAGVIARTRKHMQFPPGEDGPMYVDHDRKGMPAGVKTKMAGAGGLWGALIEVAPGLAQAGRVERASTSAGLVNTTTGESFLGSGGRHLFVHVADVADIPRAIKALHDRCTLAGYGWAIVSKSGAILHRSIVDWAVGTPEHLAFEGPPVVEPPLAQDAGARKPKVFDGGIADTAVAIPDLIAAERGALKALRDAMAAGLAAGAAKAKGEHVDGLVRRIVKKDPNCKVPAALLRDRIMQSYKGRLAPEFLLEFDDAAIGVKSVAEVLADPQRFVGETLADPLEGVDYGRCKAKVMTDDRGDGLFVNSFAHGGMGYRLMLDEGMLHEMIRVSDPAVVVGVFAEALGRAMLFPGSEETLTAECAKRAKVGLKVVRQAVEEAREARKAEARAAAARLEPPDHRTLLPAPAKDAEVGVFVAQVDAAMALSATEPPAMRNVDGKLVIIKEEKIPGLHVLLEDDNGPVLDAEPEWRIIEVEGVGVMIEVERRVRLKRVRKDKSEDFVRLDPPFCDGLNLYHPDTRIPTVTGVQTLPLVARRSDGTFVILAQNGLHRKLEFFFEIDPSIRAALPDPTKITFADGEAAYRFLTEKWLVDVDTDGNGKAVIVASAMTVIQRQVLHCRPGFIFDAPQKSTGKTTTANMVSQAALGRSASASTWSSSEIERDKATFSFLRAGAAMIVWDNITAGTKIRGGTTEAALTGRTLENRVLGGHTTGRAPATTIQFWTGNNIAPVDETVGRVFVANLRALRVDPEERAFAHPDPIGWTAQNRVKILAALYVLLCLPRPIVAQGETRMKTWWKMVGHPIELVSGVSFKKMIDKTRVEDANVRAVETVLGALLDKFKDKPFTARNVTGLLTPGLAADFGTPGEHIKAQAAADLMKGALEEVSGTGFPSGPIQAQAVGKKLTTILMRPAVIGGDTVRLIVDSGSARDENKYRIESIGQAAKPSSAGTPPPSKETPKAKETEKARQAREAREKAEADAEEADADLAARVTDVADGEEEKI